MKNFLADMKMYGRLWPGRIREELTIPFDRPRKVSYRERPEIMEIKWHIWHLLEDGARKSIGLAS